MKTYTLETFHFDPFKRGKILRDFIDESEYSYAQVAKIIGTTYDSLINYLAGRVQSLPFEKLFKICVITGHNINEFLQKILEDEPVDFADRIVWDASPASDEKTVATNTNTAALDTKTRENLVSDATAAARTCPAMDYFVDQINEAQERVMNRYKGIHDSYTQQLVKQQEHELALLDERYNKSVTHLKDQIKKLERKNGILTGALVLENLAIAGVLLFDALNRNIGWFRSYFNLSNIFRLKS